MIYICMYVRQSPLEDVGAIKSVNKGDVHVAQSATALTETIHQDCAVSRAAQFFVSPVLPYA